MKNPSDEYWRELVEMAETPEDLEIVLRQWEQSKSASGENEQSQKWTALTLSEVAAFFGLSIQTVKQWRMESPAMPGSEGNWPLNEIVRWRHAKLARSDVAEAQKKVNLERSEVALQAERMEFEKDRGQLVEIGEVERWAATAMVEFREVLLSIPDRIAGAAPPDLRNKARKETERVCDDLLKMLVRRLDTDEIQTEVDSSAESA